MRDIGNEIAPHMLEFFEARDVARQQQFLRIAVGHDLHREDDRVGARRVQFQRMRVVVRLNVGDKLRLAQQVDYRLPAVGIQIEVEMMFGHIIAPVDTIFGIKADHTIRVRTRGLTKTYQRLRQFLMIAVFNPLVTIEECEELIPRTGRPRNLPRRRLFQPACETAHVANVIEQQCSRSQAKKRQAGLYTKDEIQQKAGDRQPDQLQNRA